MNSFGYQQGSDIPRQAHGTWYRGKHCNFIASTQNLQESDAIDRYFLHGWLPEKPFISKTDLITTFGSCFAENITTFLDERGYRVGGSDLEMDAHVIRFGAGMVNTYAIRQQFEWAFENKDFSEQLWFGSKGELAGYNETIKKTTRDLFLQTDVFIITLGLAEVWYNKITEDVFWRAIPKELFDDNVHGFRVTSCSENVENLEKIYSLIRKHRPTASVIVTLSPVPLVATFRPVSCSTANSVSKSILRAAIDEFYRNNLENGLLYYFPSFEIVKEYFVEPYIQDNRHIRPEVVNTIMDGFSRNFLVGYSDGTETKAHILSRTMLKKRVLLEDLIPHLGIWSGAKRLGRRVMLPFKSST